MRMDLIICYAAYDIDDGEEAVYFKKMPSDFISKMMRALLCQRVFRSYEIRKKEEEYRHGFINTGFMVKLTDINAKKVPLPFMKRMMQEIAFAMGYDLRFVSYNKLINLKCR